MLCKKCVMPEYKPYIWFNENGICNICVEFDKTKNCLNSENTLLESNLIKTINRFKGKEKYDCLVMCSGGKDSTSSLYYIKKRYKLNPLAFTFDNGFEDPQAIKNVEHATDILGIDWIYFKSSFMNDFFKEYIKTKSKFPACTLCSLWYMQRTFDIATKYNLPLIIAGWTPGQLTPKNLKHNKKRALKAGFEFELLCQDIPNFIEKFKNKYSQYKNFTKKMSKVYKKYKISKKAVIISPHWFLPNDPDEYESLIKEKLSWEPIKCSYPTSSTNCSLNIIGSYLSLKGYHYTHFHVEMSRLIRLGKLSRDEAFKKLKLDITIDPYSSIVHNALNKLNCSTCDIKNDTQLLKKN